MRIFPHPSQSQKAVEPPQESITALHSWMQKNEQMIASISGRLAVVETRLSLVAPLSGPEMREETGGPVQRLLGEGRKNHAMNVKAWARVLDQELTLLQTSVQDHGVRLGSTADRLTAVEKSMTETAALHEAVKTDSTQLATSVTERLDKVEQRLGRPMMMRLGRFELPLEVSGILMGGLAFTVAALIFLGQKAVLVDPAFLAGVGCVFLTSALAKRVIMKTRKMPSPARPGVACATVNGYDEKA